MKAIFLLSLFAAMLICLPEASHSKNCGESSGVDYCIWQGSDSSRNVVVYLHGVGRTATDWDEDKVSRGIIENWALNDNARPHVIGLSLGRYWWYREAEFGEKLNQALEAAENQLQVRVSERYLLGDSMGGHNSLRWASDFPEQFDRLAVICPAIPRNMTKLKDGSEGRWPFNAGVEWVFQSLYPLGDDSVEKITSMFDFVNLASISRVLVAATPTDHYGFYAGNLDLFHKLRDLKPAGTTQFIKEEVRHCLVSSEPLAEFLSTDFGSL